MASFNYIHKKTTDLLPNRFHNFNSSRFVNSKNLNADFGQAQKKVAHSEGGYQNNPKDAGNYTGGHVGKGDLIGTNYGIAAPTLSHYLGRTATVSDMKNLSYDTAVSIYKANYWNPLQLDAVNNQDLAYLIYDTSVNMGEGTAKRFVTDSLGGLRYSAANINSLDAASIFNSVKDLRQKEYIALGGSFLTGWLDRLNSITMSGIDTLKRHKKRVGAVIAIITVSLVVSLYFINKTKKIT